MLRMLSNIFVLQLLPGVIDQIHLIHEDKFGTIWENFNFPDKHWFPKSIEFYYRGMNEMTEVFQLPHWGRDKLATISQTTLSNAISWMTIFEST